MKSSQTEPKILITAKNPLRHPPYDLSAMLARRLSGHAESATVVRHKEDISVALQTQSIDLVDDLADPTIRVAMGCMLC